MAQREIPAISDKELMEVFDSGSDEFLLYSDWSTQQDCYPDGRVVPVPTELSDEDWDAAWAAREARLAAKAKAERA